MRRKYLSFDIETAKVLPEDFGDLLSYRPLGICCAGALKANNPLPELFYSEFPNGNPAPEMSQSDLSNIVDILLESVDDGYTIVTHNGLGFDFNVLAEESWRLDDCRKLALGHIDMMFHVFCGKGFGVGLNAAAKAIGLCKPDNMDGSVAPQLWKDGDHKRVLDYVSHDCKMTLEVAVTSEQKGSFRWITKRDTTASFDIPHGWLTVHDAMNLPLPDTSWMDNPWPRSKFTDWLS